MKNLYAFYRLLWRPVTWLPVAFMLFMIAGWPWFFVSDGGTVLDLFRAHLAAPDTLRAMWRDTLLVPFVFGSVTLMATGILLGDPFARALPSVRTRLLRGALTMGITLSLAIALVHARVEGAAVAVTAFTVSLLAYGYPVAALLLPVRNIVGRALFLVGVVLIAHPAFIIGPSTNDSTPMAAAAFLISVALIVRGCLPVPAVRATASARARGDMSREERLATVRWFFPNLSSSARESREWRRSLAAGRMVDWIRATTYETNGDRRRGWMTRSMISSAYAACVASLFGGVVILALAIIPMSDKGASPLRGGLLYPISRAKRARLRFWVSLSRSSFRAVTLAVLLPGLYMALAPLRERIGFDISVSFPLTVSLALVSVAVGFALAPLWQVDWALGGGHGSPRARVAPRSRMRQTIVSVGPFATWVLGLVGGGLFIKTMAHADLAVAAGSTAALILIMHGLYWFGLQWLAAHDDA